jgi:hypothetical protein
MPSTRRVPILGSSRPALLSQEVRPDAGCPTLDARKTDRVFSTSRGLDGFKPQILASDFSTSGPVIPPPGWVKDGGSLAGKDISNSFESSRSCSFFDFDFCFFAWRSICFVIDLVPLIQEPSQMDPAPSHEHQSFLLTDVAVLFAAFFMAALAPPTAL